MLRREEVVHCYVMRDQELTDREIPRCEALSAKAMRHDEEQRTAVVQLEKKVKCFKELTKIFGQKGRQAAVVEVAVADAARC